MKQINEEFIKALNSSIVRTRLESIGGSPTLISSAEFETQVRREIGVNAELVKVAHIQSN